MNGSQDPALLSSPLVYLDTSIPLPLMCPGTHPLHSSSSRTHLLSSHRLTPGRTPSILLSFCKLPPGHISRREPQSTILIIVVFPPTASQDPPPPSHLPPPLAQHSRTHLCRASSSWCILRLGCLGCVVGCSDDTTPCEVYGRRSDTAT